MKTALRKIKRWFARLACFVRGHDYPAYVIYTWSMYFCARGCGREYTRGYLTSAQLEKAFDELPPRPDDDEDYCWHEEYE